MIHRIFDLEELAAYKAAGLDLTQAVAAFAPCGVQKLHAGGFGLDVDDDDLLVEGEEKRAPRAPKESPFAKELNAESEADFIASTPDEDRALDVVNQNWRLRDWRANPVILDNHSRRVVGRGVGKIVDRDTSRSGTGWLAIRVEFDIACPDPLVRAVAHQHLSGFRKGCSVSFIPGKATLRSKLPSDHFAFAEPVEVSTSWGTYKRCGTYYDRPALSELSMASVGMHPGALQLRAFVASRTDDRAEAASIVAQETTPKAFEDEFRAILRAGGERLERLQSVLLAVLGPDAPPPPNPPNAPRLVTDLFPGE